MNLRAAAISGLFLLLTACGEGGGTPEGGAAQAKAANVEVVDLAKLDGVLASYRGRAVVVNFWATWCAPCVEELPDLIAAGREAGSDDLVLLLVSYDLQIPEANAATIVPRVRTFVEKFGIEAPVLVYEGDLEPINERFDLPGHIPVTLAFDRQGKIVDREDGPTEKARFAALMRAALGG
jgi:thiol-disulfide isomerase/thioredoxin